jgi:cardiolipin synthase
LSIQQSEHNDASSWQSEVLYFEGDDYFKAVIEQIKAAQHEIFLESYIYDLDVIGRQILKALGAAAQRGVTVRVLVDGIGSYNWLSPLRDECRTHKISFRIYHPLPFGTQKMRKISWRNLRLFLSLFRKINRRNHRKVIVIDRSKAFLGSFNISQVHSKKLMGKKAWRDTGIFVEGPSVHRLQRAFMTAWSKSQFRLLSKAHSPLRLKRRNLPFKAGLIRLNSKIRWRYSLLRDLRRRMRLAQHRILIANAYFLPRQSVLRGLRRAAQRGVFVGLCIPAKSDVWFVKEATKSLYYRLLSDGVFIFEYQPTILHAKTLVIDQWATVGSHNLNHRSLTHDLEAEAVVTHPENIEKLIDKWDEDICHSVPVHLADLGKIRWWNRLLSRFIYWFRYWI